MAKIRQLELDVNTYENNIGFIAKSSKSQGLIEELNSKIENTRQRLNLLQEKLKALATPSDPGGISSFSPNKSADAVCCNNDCIDFR